MAMNCPSCRHDSPNDARFCAQCGASLTQPAALTPSEQILSTPASPPGGRGKSGRIVVAVVLLLLFVSSYAVVHRAANQTAAPAPGGARTTAQPDNSIAKAAGPQHGAPSAGNPVGLALGAGSRGERDQGKTADNAPQAGRSVHEKWDATARHGELSLSVGERFAVDVVGDNVGMATLKNALARIDLAKLESMKDANPFTQ